MFGDPSVIDKYPTVRQIKAILKEVIADHQMVRFYRNPKQPNLISMTYISDSNQREIIYHLDEDCNILSTESGTVIMY